MKQTAAKRRLRHKTTRRHIKRQYEGGVGPGHFVGAVGEAYHIQHGFFAMLSLAAKNKDYNLLAITGLTSAGALAAVSTAGLAVVGIGILLFAAMAVRESIRSQEKLRHTVTELIRVLRKIQKTMILCMTISTNYKIVINTHDLNVCLSKIYASLIQSLNNDARKLVETSVKIYAHNYEKDSSAMEGEVDHEISEPHESEPHEQKPNKVRKFFSDIRISISGSYSKWFKSDAKEKELRELMNELTPFLVLLLSQSVLQFMVCQTSMITAGTSGQMELLKTGNEAVKTSCQYKDFQLSALLDSIMRIRDDLDRDLENRVSHIEALTKEVTRITEIVNTNSNYTSFTVLKGKLATLSAAITADNYNYDNIRDNLDDLNTYDEQVFFKECKSQPQTESTPPLQQPIVKTDDVLVTLDPETTTPIVTPQNQRYSRLFDDAVRNRLDFDTSSPQRTQSAPPLIR